MSDGLLELQRCLSEAGWETEIVDDGLEVPGGMPVDQFPAYQKASDECDLKLHPDRLTPSDLSDDQWNTVYDLEVATADCLRKEGYDIPPVPSKQNYIGQSVDNWWSSYSFIGQVDQAEWKRLNKVCPQPRL